MLQHDDAMLAIASGRYEWIGRMVRAAVVTPARADRPDRPAGSLGGAPVWGW